MPEQQTSKVLEFSYGEVCKSSCLTRFSTHNADANVRLLDHIHIVKPITDGQDSLLVIEKLFDKIHCISLLLRR